MITSVLARKLVRLPGLLLAFSALVLSGSVFFISATAYGQILQQNIGIQQMDLIRQLKSTDMFLKMYARRNDHFPASVSEFDPLLLSLYKQISLSLPNSTIAPGTNGKWRTFYQFAIAVDPSFLSVPQVNGQYQIPDSWQAPPNTIVIMTDGSHEAAVWAAGADGSPAVDPTVGPNATPPASIMFRETIVPSAAPQRSIDMQ